MAYRLFPSTFGDVREVAQSKRAAWIKRPNKDYGSVASCLTEKSVHELMQAHRRLSARRCPSITADSPLQSTLTRKHLPTSD